jgi:hypothetical protein
MFSFAPPHLCAFAFVICAGNSVFRSSSQPEELLRMQGRVVGVWRGCARNVTVNTNHIRRALQRPSRRPGQHQIVSLV